MVPRSTCSSGQRPVPRRAFVARPQVPPMGHSGLGRYHPAMLQETPETQALIRARQLKKCFGTFTAVDGVDFDVAPGEAFGFLGPNGAGKTSTMRMIGTVSPVTSGTLTVFGLDPRHDGARI